MTIIVGDLEGDTIAYLVDGAKGWASQRVKAGVSGRPFLVLRDRRMWLDTLMLEADVHVFTVPEAETIRLYAKYIKRAYYVSIKDNATCERCMIGLEEYLASAHSEAKSIAEVDPVYASLFDILLDDYYAPEVIGTGRHSNGLIRAFQAVLRKRGGFGDPGELAMKASIETTWGKKDVRVAR